MAEHGLCLAFQFGDNALGQHFTQFDAPLVERVDVPDGALGEDAVLVEGDELAERCRLESLGEIRRLDSSASCRRSFRVSSVMRFFE
jgi:hypothetical protein